MLATGCKHKKYKNDMLENNHTEKSQTTLLISRMGNIS